MQPEQNAFLEDLFRQNYRRLFLYAVALLKSPDRAEDVVQDTFHEAVRKIDTLICHPKPAAWLMETLKYKIYNSQRERRKYLLRFLSLDSDMPTELASEENSIEKIIESSQTDPLEKVKQTLSEDEFYLLRRIIFEGASHLTVSQELNITVWTSQKRLERVRKKLTLVFPEYKRKKKFLK